MPVAIVSDPHASAGTIKKIAQLHRPLERRVVCVPTNPEEGVTRLHHDLLRAVGKRRAAGRLPRGSEAAAATELWLAAERVTHLVVTEACHLDTDQLQALAHLAARTPLRLWLYTQSGIPQAKERALRAIAGAIRRPPVEDLLRELRPLDHDRSRPSGRPFPHVPLDHAVTFRAACRRLLDAEDFAVVDNTLWWSARTARGALGLRPPPPVAEVTRHVVDAAPEFDEALTMLRGCQLAALERRLRLDAAPLAVRAYTETLRLRTDSATLARLRAWTRPTTPALIITYAATRAPLTSLAALRTGAVQPDGRTVEVGSAQFAIPAAATPLLRAQLADRAAAGATSDDPLFTASRDATSAATPAALANALDRGLRAIGIAHTRGSSIVHALASQAAPAAAYTATLAPLH